MSFKKGLDVKGRALNHQNEKVNQRQKKLWSEHRTNPSANQAD